MKNVVFSHVLRGLMLFIALSGFMSLSAQLSKTVVSEKGKLKEALELSLSEGETLDQITELTITGELDGRDSYSDTEELLPDYTKDFETVRLLLINLERLDLSGVTAIYDGENNLAGIPWRAFSYLKKDQTKPNEKLKTVVLPTTIQKLGGDAFWDCRALEEINFPATLTDVPQGCFTNCYSLKSFNVDPENARFASENGVLYSKDMKALYALPYAWAETEYNMPATIEKIEWERALVSSNVKHIGLSASVSINDDKRIFQYLEGSDNLESITVPEENVNFRSIDGVLFNADMTELLFYPAAKADRYYCVPEGIINLGGAAFANSKNLLMVDLPSTYVQNKTSWQDERQFFNSSIESITLPKSLQNMNWGFLRGCKNLKQVICLGDVPVNASPNVREVFWDSKIGRIVVPVGSLEAYETAWEAGSDAPTANKFVEATIVDSPNGELASILGESAASIEELLITGDMIAADYFFMRDGMTALKKVDLYAARTLASQITTTNGDQPQTESYDGDAIPQGAFNKNGSIESVVLPMTTKVIQWNTFDEMAKLSSVSMSVYVNGNINPSAFVGSLQLKEIILDSRNLSLLVDNGVLYSKNKETLYIYPPAKEEESYTMLPETKVLRENAIRDAAALKSITFSPVLEKIENRSLANMDGIVRLDLPSTVSDIAIWGIELMNLAEINIEEGGVFKSVEGVLYTANGKELVKYPRAKTDKHFVFPDGLERLRRESAGRTLYLESVIVPEGVTFMDEAIFIASTSLKSIILPSTLDTALWGLCRESRKLEQLIIKAEKAPVSKTHSNELFWDTPNTAWLGVSSQTAVENYKKTEDENDIAYDPDNKGWTFWLRENRQPIIYHTVTVENASSPYPLANEKVKVPIYAPLQNENGEYFSMWDADADIVIRDKAANETYFQMPNRDAVVKAIYKKGYNIVVENGTAVKEIATEGESISIEAGTVAGQQFYRWEADGVTFADPYAAKTTFTMIASDVTIKAVFKTPYGIMVEGGVAYKSQAVEGQVVEISADEPEVGYVFDKWESEDVVFADATNPETSFTMVGKDVSIVAKFKRDDTAIDDVDGASVNLYPNPASDYIIVTGLVEGQPYAIYNNAGVLCIQGTITGAPIDVQILPAGSEYIFVSGVKVLQFMK
ncbi:MAG: leucine-rich repeat protein [Bacteroidales bacterium]|nr:leucine-rich repeat protein [Bacteroidales bacterium]